MLKKEFANGWTQVPNAIINHSELSFKAKGLWTYINSKKEGWDFAVWRIANETREGEKSIRSGLNELVKFGFLKYEPKKDEAGKFIGQIYILSDQESIQKADQEQSPHTPFQETPFLGDTQKGGHINKKELNKTKFNNSLSIDEKVEQFVTNPMYGMYKQVNFPNLEEAEIKVNLGIYLNDYPDVKATSINNYLRDLNKKKARTYYKDKQDAPSRTAEAMKDKFKNAVVW